MLNIRTHITGQYAEALTMLYHALGNAGRSLLNQAAAHSLAVDVRTHISEYAQNHHKTANEIAGGPAPYTRHLIHAAENVTEPPASSVEGIVAINSPGFRRAIGEMEIRPREKEHLTIPVHALAYGHSVSELRREGVAIFRPKGRDFLATTTGDGTEKKLLVLYVLKKLVKIPHEPDLLPAEKTMGESAKRGVVGELVRIKRKAGRP